MKKRKSFLKRHIIAISLLLLVGVYSMYSLYVKEQRLSELEMTSEQRIEEVQTLKREIERLEVDFEQVGTLAYFERYARETFKMVGSKEVYFHMIYDEEK